MTSEKFVNEQAAYRNAQFVQDSAEARMTMKGWNPEDHEKLIKAKANKTGAIASVFEKIMELGK